MRGNKLHVIPLGGGECTHFLSETCWCQPYVEDGEETGESGKYPMVIHHASDVRERYERQGIKLPGKSWGIFDLNGRVS